MTDWDKVKEGYDNGLTDAELAEQFGINKATVRVHRNRSGWGKANRAKRVYKNAKKRVTNSKRNVTKDVTEKRNVTDERNVTFEFEDSIASAQDLTKAQALFCQHYLENYNATQAYKKAYDCSYDSARNNGSRLLANDSIQKYLSDLQKRQSNKLFINANNILLEYAKRAFANIGDYVHVKKIRQQRLDENGNPVSDIDGNPIIDTYNQIYADDSSEMDMSLISEIHKGKDGLVVKLKDDKDALKALLERLPEPVDDTPQQNTFLNALEMSQKVFSENEQTNENEQNSTDENNNADK